MRWLLALVAMPCFAQTQVDITGTAFDLQNQVNVPYEISFSVDPSSGQQNARYFNGFLEHYDASNVAVTGFTFTMGGSVLYEAPGVAAYFGTDQLGEGGESIFSFGVPGDSFEWERDISTKASTQYDLAALLQLAQSGPVESGANGRWGFETANVSIVSVPEPPILGLIAMGFLLVVVFRGSRR